jgi:hypothetical protein
LIVNARFQRDRLQIRHTSGFRLCRCGDQRISFVIREKTAPAILPGQRVSDDVAP